MSNRRSVVKSAAVVVAAGVLVLTGCGRSAPSEVASVDDNLAEGTVEFWYAGGTPDAIESIATAFEKENPQVNIEITNVPEKSLDAKMIAAITSGKVPDLAHLTTYTERSMIETGGFAAVPDELVDPSAYFDTAWQGGTKDGVAYAVPWTVATAVLQYRKDLAEAAGVEAPTTWDELTSFTAALQQAGAEYGYALNVGYNQYAAADFQNFAEQNGGHLLNSDGSAWTINDPKNVEALEFTWGNMVKNDVASADGPLFLDTVPWFTEGKVGAIVMGPWFEDWLVEAKGEEWTRTHLATAVVPAGDAGSVTGFTGDVLGVPKDASNPDAAWKFVRYLSDPEVQVRYYQESGILPSVRSAWDAPEIADNPLMPPFKTAMETAVNTPQVSTWVEVGPIIGQALEKVARGQMSAQQALDEAQQRAEAIGVGSN